MANDYKYNMKLQHIIPSLIQSTARPMLQWQLESIVRECSQFLYESDGLPVFKYIDHKRQNFTKLKIRTKNSTSSFEESFNAAFGSNIRQRSLYASGNLPVTENTYYVFPADGYKYVYNPLVSDSNIYEQQLDSISDQSLLSEVIQTNYYSNNLVEGIESGAELLFYNTPYCYAVNTTLFDDYKDLLSML